MVKEKIIYEEAGNGLLYIQLGKYFGVWVRKRKKKKKAS